jgi:NAD(P)-dependent dehydrogenase (short-subunit alcohol dehydrogenase family)
MSKLTGKVAIVTGASKGIGAAIAKSLAVEGASVIVNYASSKAGADAVVSAITSAGGKAVAVRGDVSKAAEAQGLIDVAIKNFGRLDILVNNSGVLAKELGARKIRVNSINPGMVETEGAHAAGFIGSDFEKGAVAQTPLGRIGQVDEIASVATFLASNDAKWITGELVRVGGGLR